MPKYFNGDYSFVYEYCPHWGLIIQAASFQLFIDDTLKYLLYFFINHS